MSDEKVATPHKDCTLYVHLCEHPDCTKWGSFGFGYLNLLGGRSGLNASAV